MSPRLVPAEAVRPRVEPTQLAFETTDALPSGGTVGELAMRLQPRARAALELCVASRAPGFHVFAAGASHLGKQTAVLAHLRAASRALPRAADWAYVFNEAQPDQPVPLKLPAGRGAEYARLVAEAVVRVQRELGRVLRSARVRRREAALEDDMREAEDKQLQKLRASLRERHFDVKRIEGQLEAVPLWKGRPLLKPFSKLPAAQRKLIEARLPELSELVEESNRHLGEVHAGFEDKQRALHRDAAKDVATRALEPLRRAFAGSDEALAHLAQLEAAMIEHHALFLERDDEAEAARKVALLRFSVHVLVTHEHETGAPVVLEGSPTASALFGAISRELEDGVLTTDFRHLRPGALHRANGGFLVLPARVLLAQPEVWPALKRCLRTREIHVPEDDGAAQAAQVLRPQPVPLECNVVLTGEPELGEALYEQDPDFRELFGVRAEFHDTAPLDAGTVGDAAAMVAALARNERLLPFDASGVARVLEHSLRLAADQRRLSLEWDRLRLLLVEASHEARRDGDSRVKAAHVRRAEDAAHWRDGLPRDELRQEVERGLLRLQVSGAQVGQVNALALISLGDSLFGRVTRVSARVGPGVRGLIDIEHRATLSGPVHTKAVMQLQGYLLGRFGGERPLTLDATLTFEQSYHAVEGDSASVAELVAVVSALAGAPVRQNLAVSCSLGQDGAAQVVGGITDKVEGFFEACRTVGLDGTQGVILAANNVQHLVLRDEVAEAIERGRFHLHAIDHADDALELLLGLPSWDVDARVTKRLEAFRAAVKGLRDDPR